MPATTTLFCCTQISLANESGPRKTSAFGYSEQTRKLLLVDTYVVHMKLVHVIKIVVDSPTCGWARKYGKSVYLFRCISVITKGGAATAVWLPKPVPKYVLFSDLQLSLLHRRSIEAPDGNRYHMARFPVSTERS